MVTGRKSGFYKEFRHAYDLVTTDFGGGSLQYKTYLMAYLALNFNLKIYVEIGVYKGKSLFPIALAFKRNSGYSIGIDPYGAEFAKQSDLDAVAKEEIDTFIDNTNFEKIYNDVLVLREKLGLTKDVEIIKQTSEEAIKKLRMNNLKIDMLHIDGNHDTAIVQSDVDNYTPYLSDGGFLIFDDINWESVKPVYDKVKSEYIVVFEHELYAILLKSENNISNSNKAIQLERKLTVLFEKLYLIENSNLIINMPIVTVGVLTFNHEKYIKECLSSIYEQTGEFSLKVIVLDNGSTDGTAEIIRNFMLENPSSNRLEWIFKQSKENIGIFKGFGNLIEFSKQTNCDYFTLCDGDDYWMNSNRISTHISFLKNNPECSLSFNMLMLYWEEEESFENPKEHEILKGEIFETIDIIKFYFIGNASCCFYDGSLLKNITKELFHYDIGDWMFNIFFSLYGDIGFIRKPLSVYRKHSGGGWTGRNIIERHKISIKAIDDFNSFLNFEFDKELTISRNGYCCYIDGQFSAEVDLMIIDDFFPHPLSAFRYQEFTSYFEHIKSVKIMSSVQSYGQFSKASIDDVIIDYKRNYPHTAGKISKFVTIPTKCKLMYFIFLCNIYSNLSLVEQNRIPFVFTLYPGGQFALNNHESDRKLKRVFKSPCFQKVIVTQKVTYQYLLDKKLCPKEKIEFIFGGVIPLDTVESNYPIKKRFGIGKETLDICFIANKYTQFGQDKGYDIFIETARILVQKYDNIYFHVVGTFNKDVINVNSIDHRIKFYGTLSLQELDEFCIDKDIVLSPNMNDKMAKGTFDGFPTGSCIEAGLRKTAIFCTDPLDLNQSYFIDGEEIVILEYNIKAILNKIEYYYNNPGILKTIGEKGCTRIKELFSFESQIASRLKLLRVEMEKPFIYDDKDFLLIDCSSYSAKLIIRIKKITPKPVKLLYHKLKAKCPKLIKKMYHKLRRR